MNYFRTALSQNSACLRNYLKSSFISNNIRHFCEYPPNLPTEKSINRVTLLGRVGINPQLRGSELKPVVVFSLATNINYKYESGEYQQKTEWHRISVFKPHLRELVLDYLKKGSRIYIEGRLVYGEFTDAQGVMHNSSSVVANEIVFVDSGKKNVRASEEVEDSSV